MKKLKIESFLEYKFLSNLKINPNGKNFAFVKHKMDEENNNYNSNIFLHRIDENKTIQLTNGNKENSFQWRDEDTLVFLGNREKDSKDDITYFYEININGGEAKKIFSLDLKVSRFEFIDKNKIFLVATYENLEKEEDFHVIDEIPFTTNGLGVTNKNRQKLYIYDIKKEELLEITEDLESLSQIAVNDEGDKLIFTTIKYKNKMPLKNQLYLYDIKTKKRKKIRDEFRYYYINFLEDRIIFTGHNMENYGLNENGKIYSMNLEGEDLKRLCNDNWNFSKYSSVGSDSRYGGGYNYKVDGKYLYFLTTEGYSSYLNRIDLKGNIEKLTFNKGSIDAFDVIGNSIYFIAMRDLKLQEIYKLENKAEKPITNLNSNILKKYKTSQPEHFIFNSSGYKLDGWIMKPVDYDENKNYPALLHIHGGPKTVFGDVFFHEMQVWANEGYFVFYTNPVGSDGRGDKFSDIRGKYGSIDYENLMDLTDIVLEKYPNIDKNKLGVVGGSYGGFMTNWIIGHTNRFKAAVSQRSISNWFSFFGTTDIGFYFTKDQQATDPWDNPEKLWHHSPLKYANNVETPTLFIHSLEDYRCWVPEAMQMFTALKYFGVDSRLVTFEGENHDLSRSGRPKSRIRRMREIIDWFNKYLK